MLQLKLLQTNEVDATGKLVYLSDATGVYSLDNLGGYGVPNSLRSAVALIPVGYVINSVGLKTPLVFVANNPLIATSWTAIIPHDGWLQFNLLAFNAVVAPDATTTAIGEVLFSITDFKLYQVVKGITVPEFKEIKAEDTQSYLFISKSFDQFFIANSVLVKNQLNKRFTESLMKSENLSQTVVTKRIKEQYDTIRGILQSALYQFCIGNKYQAAKFIEFLITNNYGQL